MPDVPGAINVSGDGRTAIAVLADGTIRWFSMADGKPLLTLYFTPDRNRWVLWTPSGYYDASPGGEDIIGWNISRSRDAASDFYPASRFHSSLYRPDVVASVLGTDDEASALQSANAKTGRKPSETTVAQALPPVVHLLSPTDQAEFSSSEVSVVYSLRSPSGEPLTNVRVLVDGRPLSGHGINDKHNDYYFLPVNFDENALRRTALAFSDIRTALQHLAGKVVLMVDSCHSGNVIGAHGDQNGLSNELSSPESGVVVFAASTGNQYALERAELRNGVFTSALVEGLNGAADFLHKGTITVTALELYLSNRVKELTDGQQTPTTAKPQTIADFAIAQRP